MSKLVDYAKQFKSDSYIGHRNYIIVLLFVLTGMRVTALSEISYQDLSEDLSKLKVYDKGGKYHEYVFNDKIQLELARYCLELRKASFRAGIKRKAFFITTNGKRLNSYTIKEMIEDYSQNALGYRITPHKIRAAVCSILYDKTQNIEFVRRAIGHSNIETTKRYIVTENKEREEASELLSQIVLD